MRHHHRAGLDTADRVRRESLFEILLQFSAEFGIVRMNRRERLHDSPTGHQIDQSIQGLADGAGVTCRTYIALFHFEQRVNVEQRANQGLGSADTPAMMHVVQSVQDAGKPQSGRHTLSQLADRFQIGRRRWPLGRRSAPTDPRPMVSWPLSTTTIRSLLSRMAAEAAPSNMLLNVEARCTETIS